MHFIKNTYPQNLFIRDAYYNYRIEDGKIAKKKNVFAESASARMFLRSCNVVRPCGTRKRTQTFTLCRVFIIIFKTHPYHMRT